MTSAASDMVSWLMPVVLFVLVVLAVVGLRSLPRRSDTSVASEPRRTTIDADRGSTTH